MISCRTVTSLHTAAEEGALTGFDAFRYAVHMKVCGPCKRYREQLRATTAVLGQLDKEAPSENLVDRLARELEHGE